VALDPHDPVTAHQARDHMLGRRGAAAPEVVSALAGAAALDGVRSGVAATDVADRTS